MERRNFLAGAAAAVAVSTTAGLAQASSGQSLGQMFDTESNGNGAARLPRAASAGTLRGEMLYRPLGKTGVEVSAIGLGGSHVGNWKVPEEESVRLIHQALDRGINFMDNSWDYNEGGASAGWARPCQDGYREKVFLMTKIDGRTKKEAAARSTSRCSACRPTTSTCCSTTRSSASTTPTASSPKAAPMEALIDAQQAGKIRFIGFTGHKDPHIHLYMLEVAEQHGFRFDTVADAAERDGRALPQLRAAGAAGAGRGRDRRAGDEVLGDGIILKSNTVSRDRVPSLRAEPADLRRDHRDRQPGDPRSGLRGRPTFRPMDEAAGRGAARARRTARRDGASSSCSRPPRTSTRPQSTRSGWARTRCLRKGWGGQGVGVWRLWTSR